MDTAGTSTPAPGAARGYPVRREPAGGRWPGLVGHRDARYILRVLGDPPCFFRDRVPRTTVRCALAGDVLAQVQRALGTGHAVERELGGGGMSRVFVATEHRLGRKVVVKVLAPELAEGLSAERFEREIKVAASLQQANIVPVLSAGDAEGLPYYVMPFVEGESLRAALARTPQLPIPEVIRILGDVARALA